MEVYELRINKTNTVIATFPRSNTTFYYLLPGSDKKRLEVYKEERGKLVNVTESFSLGIEEIFGSHDEGRVSFRRLNSPDDERILRKI